MPPGEPASLTVLAGPSGVGKSTVAALIAGRYPIVHLSVSATTRFPRVGEVDGVNYHFVSPERFEAMVRGGDMLEWATYAGNRYGTPRLELKAGRPTLLEIDLAGARQVRASTPEALLIFLAPPSFSELTRRLVERDTDTAQAQDLRLSAARRELAAVDEFDAVVVNDQAEQAALEVADLMGLD